MRRFGGDRVPRIDRRPCAGSSELERIDDHQCKQRVAVLGRLIELNHRAAASVALDASRMPASFDGAGSNAHGDAVCERLRPGIHRQRHEDGYGQCNELRHVQPSNQPGKRTTGVFAGLPGST